MRLVTQLPKTAISFCKPNFHISLSLAISEKFFSSILDCGTPVSNINPKSYGQLLEACVTNKNLEFGKLIHSKIVINGLENDSFFATKLISHYSACGNVSVAELAFHRVSAQNVFLLNAMIRGYSINGLYQKALDFFYENSNGGPEPDSYTFSCLLKVCSLLSDLRQGRKIQDLALECGFGSDLFVSNSLIAMFGKCGSLLEGILVFESMPQRDIVSWNSIITAYIHNGFDCEAMVKVQELIQSSLRPDAVTMVNALSVCTSAATIREIHCYVVRNGHDSTPSVRNSLISKYGMCGQTEEAHLVFNKVFRPDKVAWNAVICSYAQNGCFKESIQLLREMNLAGFDSDIVTYSGIISSLVQNDYADEAMETFTEMLNLGLKPDVITVASILPAISDIKHFNNCKEIHGYSYRHELESDRRVRNALVSVYAKCDSIQNAVRVFAKIKDRDVISWSSMVVGYAQNGHFNESLDTFSEMIKDQIIPNPITVTSVLSACAGISVIRQGKEIHLWALKNEFGAQTFVGTALIDMYAKCGRIEDSKRVFDLMTEKNLVTLNSMIGGYAIHGLGKKALDIFRKVEEPDHISFIAALSACNHGGLIEEGIKIFNSMKDFGISPREGHFACMVDILGRSGRLNEAFDLIRTMPIKANPDIWGALLGACKIHSNLEIGFYSGAQIIESGCENPGYYVLISNILADFGKWEEVETIRKLMKERGVSKGAACSWIEMNNEVHSFVAKERAQHPEWETLSKMLRSLYDQMKEMK
ncbi:hypothetical protein HHK36_005148 [Tetracentron sinense]|uniref:Pentatricopeptide repeat-containing protein n=1 Tax=Tetracentron sinense TaxID=13715 RepID=A0A834ZL01_TETSI|nr:hypothetical protein HHK36_005148 [Tetracentron sinense]